MLEFLICSSVTILPDFLVRRYLQGKRIGQEINLFSVWYELRWGISTCVLLTVSLITMIFYYHPSTTAVNSFFRTITVVTEQVGRVEEVFVESGQTVREGQKLFTLDDAVQRAAVETAERRIAEVEAEFAIAEEQLASAEGRVEAAQSAVQQAQDELDTRSAVNERTGPGSIISERELERLAELVKGREGTLDAAQAELRAVKARLDILLPAQRASAQAQREEAEATLAKTVIHAEIDGTLEQFALKPGDIANPVLRPAGILIPDLSKRRTFQAGFGQITAQVLHVGMIAEITCSSKPFTIIPMVITEVQDVIAAGQFRPTDRLIDVQDRMRPGTITAGMKPLFEGQALDIPPGSTCIANAYTNNHARLQDPETGFFEGLFLHAVDTTGLVHALILRLQAIMLPVRTLVLSGH